MTAGQQSVSGSGSGSPLITGTFVTRAITYHDKYTVPVNTQALYLLKADGNHEDQISGSAPGTGTHSYGQYVNPPSQYSQLEGNAVVTAGDPTYLNGFLNRWDALPLTWGVTMPPSGTVYYGNVIIRISLRDKYTHIVLATADINFDVQRVNP